MKKSLPVRLGKSPLIEAIFEVRFSGTMPLSSILTGMLYSTLECSNVERLPHADIPDVIRQQDPNLRYVVLSRLTWGKYFVGVGDHVVTISTLFPYQGWSDFHAKIEALLEALKGFHVIQKLERFSLKYIDVLSADLHGDASDALGVTLDFIARDIDKRALQVRLETPFEGGVHVVQIIGHVDANVLNGPSVTGVLVDVDSIRHLSAPTVDQGIEVIKDEVTNVHEDNKSLFFEMLTSVSLEKMEPEYE